MYVISNLKMKNRVILLISAFIYLNSILCFSQGVNNRFLYGYAGTSTPTPMRNNLNVTLDSLISDNSYYYLAFDAASANISDSSGNLLFYSNGNQVMNKIHQPIFVEKHQLKFN